jgi:3-ketosteroid 9alpha-monooxygenase subunit A
MFVEIVQHKGRQTLNSAADLLSDPVLLDRGQPPSIPFGWYAIAYADELAVGEVKPMHLFGVDFVLWRGEDTRVRATDAYCVHLGAHLGYGGKVTGNDLTCPFHAWRYTGEGTVADIPYTKVIPPKFKRTCLPVWPVAEMNRLIHVWYHPHRVAPLWEPVKFDELDDPKWAPFEKFEWVINTHIRDLAENSVDTPHFFYVHRVAELPPPGVVTESGRRRETLSKIKYVTPRGPVEGSIRSGQIGPGQGYVKFEGLLDTMMLPTVVPISRTQTLNRFAFTQPEGIAGTKFGRALINEIVRQLDQDKPIWDHKRFDMEPQLVQGDGPIHKFRKYFSQFYVENS